MESLHKIRQKFKTKEAGLEKGIRVNNNIKGCESHERRQVKRNLSGENI